MSPQAERLRAMKDMSIAIQQAILTGKFDEAWDLTLVLSAALDMELLHLSIQEASGL